MSISQILCACFLPFSVQFLVCLQPLENLSVTYLYYTHIHTRTHKHTFFSFDIFLWQWTSLSTCSKRSSLLVNLSSVSKTKGLNANQALNKNSSNGKKQKNVNYI